MIGILLLIGPLFAIWNYFSRLAHDHDRSRVGFAFLGLGVYIVSLFLFAFILGIILALTGTGLAIASTFLTDIICIAFGGLCTWLVYFLLKRSWEKKRLQQNNPQLLDDLN